MLSSINYKTKQALFLFGTKIKKGGKIHLYIL